MDQMYRERDNLTADWHEFKYYKESEYRTLENKYLKLKHDFKGMEELTGDLEEKLAIAETQMNNVMQSTPKTARKTYQFSQSP